MNFRTAYSKQVRKSSCNGSKWKKCYVRDSIEGRAELKETAPENQYEVIQMARFGLSPRELLDRFSKGDTSAILPDLNSYVDLTNVPTTLEESMKHVVRCKELYSSLPKNVKAFYDNDISKLITAIDDGSFFKQFMTVESSGSPNSGLSADDITKIKELINGGNNNG